MKVKRRKILLIICIIGVLMFGIKTVILPMLKPTTFEFDVDAENYPFKIGYENFYNSPNVLYGDNFDFKIDRLELVEEVGQVQAEILVIGKTNTIYEYLDMAVIFGATLRSDLERGSVKCVIDPICNFYLDEYGKDAGREKYRNDVYFKSRIYLTYDSMEWVGPISKKIQYDFEQNGEELYDLMKTGYFVVYDQDGNIIDAIPFDFTDIIKK